MKKVKRYEDGGDVSLEKKYPGAKITRLPPAPPPTEGGKGSEQHIRNLEWVRNKYNNSNAKKELFEEKQKNLDKLNTALDRAGVPLPKKDTFPKTTAAFEEVARSDKERFDRKAEKTSGGGGGGGIPSDKMDKMKKMNYKAGGKVSSASKRADGIAIRGKTRA